MLVAYIEEHRSKWQIRAERSRRLRDIGDERYSEFAFGKSIGYIKAFSDVLAVMKSLEKETEEVCDE